MKTNVFVKTKNVKGFVALMSELENLPLKIPKIALVTGDFGLGKSETIKWWSFKNDCIYVRANQGMSSRWLLSEIADELGEEYYWNSQATFNSKALQAPKKINLQMPMRTVWKFSKRQKHLPLKNKSHSEMHYYPYTAD